MIYALFILSFLFTGDVSFLAHHTDDTEIRLIHRNEIIRSTKNKHFKIINRTHNFYVVVESLALTQKCYKTSLARKSTENYSYDGSLMARWEATPPVKQSKNFCNTCTDGMCSSTNVCWIVK